MKEGFAETDDLGSARDFGQVESMISNILPSKKTHRCWCGAGAGAGGGAGPVAGTLSGAVVVAPPHRPSSPTPAPLPPLPPPPPPPPPPSPPPPPPQRIGRLAYREGRDRSSHVLLRLLKTAQAGNAEVPYVLSVPRRSILQQRLPGEALAQRPQRRVRTNEEQLEVTGFVECAPLKRPCAPPSATSPPTPLARAARPPASPLPIPPLAHDYTSTG